MKEKNQIVKLSKFFKVLTTIVMWLMIVATAMIAISAVVIAIAMRNVDIKDGIVKVMNEEILKVETNESLLIITSEGKDIYTLTLDETDLQTANLLIEKTTSKNATFIIELVMAIGLIDSILMIMICTKIKNILQDIIEKQTPFVKNTPQNLKFVAILYSSIMVLDIIFTMVFSIITKTSINIDIPISGIISVIFILYLGYISTYGYNLESPKKGK